MSIMAQPWKHPSTGYYYFRRQVPEQLRPVIGKHEWKVSLRTKDLREARIRFASESLRCEEAFAIARDELAGVVRLKLSDVPKLADKWARHVIDCWDDEPEGIDDFLVREGDDYSPASDYIDESNKALHSKLASHFITDTLNRLSLPTPPKDDPVYTALVDAFVYRWSGLCRVAYERKMGKSWADLELLKAEEPLTAEAAKQQQTKIGPPLSKVFEGWAEDKRQTDGDTRSTRKTIGEFSTTITRFVELLGDLPVTQITRQHVQEFSQALGKLPTKGKGLRSLTMPELISKAEAEGLPTASLATVHKQLKTLSTILNFAVKRFGVIQEEPVTATGILSRIKKAIRRADTNEEGDKEYSWSELQLIFTGPVYTESWRPPRADYGEAFYWLPLIWIYTGARREEIAQLEVTDIQQDGWSGIWYFSIRPDGEDKTVKVRRRRVPIHPDLLALGLLNYKDSLPAEGMLFPKLTYSESGYGHNFGKLWAKYLREVVKLNSKADPAHGLRHTFKTLCREVGIPWEVHEWITGHAPHSEGDKYGSNPLQRMYDELTKYPSIATHFGLLPADSNQSSTTKKNPATARPRCLTEADGRRGLIDIL